MMKNPVLYKVLVVGVIVLFLSVGVQPAIALTDKEQNIKVEYVENVTYLKKGIIVDQVVETVCGSSYGGRQIKAHMPLGQSFKPLYKRHYGIELYIKDCNPGFPLVPIQILLKENNITGSFIPGTNVTLNLTSGSGWRYFEFISPVDLEINQTYVIDISTTNPRWGVEVTEGHCYTRGMDYLNGDPEPLEDLYFRTYIISNNPPSSPIIDGPSDARPRVEACFTFHSTDPDDDNVKYIIDWDDGTTNETNLNSSCIPVEVCHSWSEQVVYTIKAKAVDVYDAESNWSYFVIEIPRTRSSSYHWLLERFPLLERLLTFLLL